MAGSDSGGVCSEFLGNWSPDLSPVSQRAGHVLTPSMLAHLCPITGLEEW